MSIFSSIVNAILHHSTATNAQAQATPSAPSSPQAAGGSATAAGSAIGASAPSASASTSRQPTLDAVDVDRVLSQLASTKGGGGNWRTSIVDLMKLLGLDSSLSARKELANELNVRAGPDGSAEQNIALQKALMNKLAENGGKVPDSLRR